MTVTRDGAPKHNNGQEGKGWTVHVRYNEKHGAAVGSSVSAKSHYTRM